MEALKAEQPKSQVGYSSSVMLNVSQTRALLVPFGGVINTSTVLPILTCVLIEVRKELVKFVATDLETIISCATKPLSVKMTEEKESFSFCVEYRELMGFLTDIDQTDSPDFTMEVTPSAKMLYIKHASGFRLKLIAEPSENFPKGIDTTRVKHFKMAAKEVIPIFKNALSFISSDDLRPSMTGVYLHDSSEKGLMVAATDAHRLYFKSVSSKCPVTMKDIACIMPRKFVQTCVNVFKSGDLSMSFTQYHAIAYNDTYVVSGRLIDATYPEYKVVIPETAADFYVKRKQMISFLKLSRHFVNRSTNQIVLNTTSESISVEGGDADFAVEFSYKIPVFNPSIPDMDFKFAMNAKFLLEALLISKSEDLAKVSSNMMPDKAYIVDDNILIMPLLIW